MLDVTYEAEVLTDGRAAVLLEDRGHIAIRVDSEAPLSVVLLELNGEFARLLRKRTWFQVWEGEVISYASPGSLRIIFILDRAEPDGIEMRETRGLVTVHVDPDLTPVELAAVMNPAVRQLLDAGRWFQLYAGEVIDMCPASLNRM
jgi:hypothetical protein